MGKLEKDTKYFRVVSGGGGPYYTTHDYTENDHQDTMSVSHTFSGRRTIDHDRIKIVNFYDRNNKIIADGKNWTDCWITVENECVAVAVEPKQTLMDMRNSGDLTLKEFCYFTQIKKRDDAARITSAEEKPVLEQVN